MFSISCNLPNVFPVESHPNNFYEIRYALIYKGIIPRGLPCHSRMLLSGIYNGCPPETCGHDKYLAACGEEV